ncbi:tetratricopeptide repeat protein [Dysgonomonas mossii]|uniref:tetratricopeptide repeat protein n=1 Tax=Dysgonomonas mossii TaxID=163665 RepID=UPI003993B4A9
MKRQKLIQFLSLVAFVAIIATSCGKKTMPPLANSLFTTNPSPLELVGTKVPVTINGRFPAKWFEKSTTVVVTPVLKYAGGETLGTPYTYQGEKVAGNGIVVPYEAGSAITMKSEFDYIPAMKKSELFLRFDFHRGGKQVVGFGDVKIADGVVATQALANAGTSAPAVAPDAFQRIIKEAYDADIMFLIQRAELRSSELNSTNLNAWKELVKEADSNERKKVDVEISAYASPDGGFKLNDQLAEKREKNTTNYLTKEFKKNSIDTEINAKYTAQDWDGFQKLVQASSLQDKDLVLRVLSMYPDPETREKEIKNISVVYSDLAETILPKLRRSRLLANVEIIGKTDEELKNIAVSGNLGDLTVEELLYAANLNGVSKEKVYTFVTQKFPNDYRGWNNLGAYYYKNGQNSRAVQAFNKAAEVSSRAAEANMNLALVSLADGNTAKAEQLLGNAAGANSLGETMGLMYIQKGEYNRAVQSFGNTVSNNAALAQILTKNYSRAQQILDAVPTKDATTYYLAAIVAARTNSASGVAGNLKSAIQNGVSPAEIAKDIEFAKFLTNPDIKNMLF